MGKLETVRKLRPLCPESRDNCRARISLLPLASIILYGTSFYFAVLIIWNLRPTEVMEVLPAELRHHPGIAEQLQTMYRVVILAFMIHLGRLYLSILIIDESVEAYHAYFHDLAVWQRVLEFLLRLAIFLFTIVFMEHHIIERQTPTLVDFAERGVIIYILMCCWDLLMWFFLRPLDPRRQRYLYTDLLGLTCFSMLTAISWKWVVTDGNFFLITFATVGLAVILMGIVIKDIVKQWRDYWHHFLSYFLFFGLKCVYHSNGTLHQHLHYSMNNMNFSELWRFRESEIHCSNSQITETNPVDSKS